MNNIEGIYLAAAIFSAACAVTVIVINRRRTRRTLNRLDDMLAAAVSGTFCETAFDESLLSAVETRMAHYLSASQVSKMSLAEEKDKIKELIADISHQTKTPIANILLYAQLLGEQNLPKESVPCVTALYGQAEKLNFLIASLVKTSRLEAGMIELHLKESEVWLMLTSVLEQIAPKAEKKKIRLECGFTDKLAKFDSKWTAEAIYNIVDNAVKYTPEGGTVSIKTIAYDLFCRIDITDTGIGIEEEEQAKIFGRFYRTETVSEMEGVGIGLYLSRRIVSDEGGYIKVKSAVGAGTTFSVFLPF